MPTRPLDPADLLHFAAVADAGSFQAAADRLHVDRSVLSRRVAALEAQLGVQLLHRSTRALSLTEAGAAIVTRARALDELLGDVRRIAGDAQDQPRGLLRISAATHFGTRCVQPAVVRYQALYPQVAVELRLDNRRTDLAAEGFDLAIRIGELPDSSLIARKLCDNPLRLAAAPAFVARHGPIDSLAALLRLPAVSYRADGLQHAALHWLDAAGRERAEPMPHIAFWSNHGEALLAAVVAGSGWGVMPAFWPMPTCKPGAWCRCCPMCACRPSAWSTRCMASAACRCARGCFWTCCGTASARRRCGRAKDRKVNCYQIKSCSRLSIKRWRLF